MEIGSLELENRTWVPAMVPWRATEDGFVTQDPNWIDADETKVRAFLNDAPDAIIDRVLNERELESLRFGYRERVTDLHLPHVRELPRVLPGIFADAAHRGREAGFDGVELHYAHAYTMAGFLSALNQAVYPYTGQSGYECMPTTLSDKLGPFGRSVPLVARIKHAVNAAGFSTPVVATGGITTFEQAEAILQRGDADIVGLARQALADPDWFVKVKLGRGDEIRRCTYTNYCEALDQAHRQVTCKLWDRKQLDEPGIAMAADGRRRLLPPKWRE